MPDLLPSIRRIVTEKDPNGRSRIAKDAPATVIHLVPERPGFRVVKMCGVRKSPPPAFPLPTRRWPRRASSLRLVGPFYASWDFPPEPQDPAELKASHDATFKGALNEAHRDHAAQKHPGMHETATLDYAIVLEGEVWSVMDEGETLLHAGDVLIQRGTNHCWANRSTRTARVAFILIDGTP